MNAKNKFGKIVVAALIAVSINTITFSAQAEGGLGTRGRIADGGNVGNGVSVACGGGLKNGLMPILSKGNGSHGVEGNGSGTRGLTSFKDGTDVGGIIAPISGGSSGVGGGKSYAGGGRVGG